MPPAIVVRLPTCVRFGPITPAAVGTPFTAWQAMHGAVRKSVAPRVTSPVTDSSKVSVVGGVDRGIAHRGSCSRGKVAVAVSATFITGVGAGGGGAGGVAALPGVVVPVAAALVAAGACGAALPIAFAFWCATHASKSRGATVNTLKRM